MIAEKQNRKVGVILKIVDHQEDEISNFGMVPTYHEKAKYPYSVTVTFALL